ncbi:uncharacterized protein LOC9631924 [Selaginella moellendorffii]|uniref:uncharacterized protein LOC9631924 n=1 Tax=Selaginella moellendorffii TaxID=88036 RepID=UPI000D1C4FBD|nr:uncharacterized protein LOC9631924 [Selaginella moellendorffii]|eukprot:XP_002991547.2 uncharacterized protein LOC9631924 [Selaginella moellendorffii]
MSKGGLTAQCRAQKPNKVEEQEYLALVRRFSAFSALKNSDETDLEQVTSSEGAAKAMEMEALYDPEAWSFPGAATGHESAFSLSSAGASSSGGFLEPNDDHELQAHIQQLSQSFDGTEAFQLFDHDSIVVQGLSRVDFPLETGRGAGFQQQPFEQPLPVMVVKEEAVPVEQVEIRPGKAFQYWSPGIESTGHTHGHGCRKKMMACSILDLYRQVHEREQLQSRASSSSAAPADVTLHQQQQLEIQAPSSRVAQAQDLQHQPQIQFQSNPRAPAQTPASYNHMLAERSRRSKESEHLATLKKFIPQGTLKKANKLAVLQATIDYIKQLRCQIAELQEQSSPSFTSNLNGGTGDQEVESLSPAATNPTSMLTEELDNNDDSRAARSAIHLSFDVKRPDHDLVRMLSCLQELGLELDSIDWKPEASSVLSLTVHHNTKMENLLSRQALHETLAKKLFTES